jgi:DNA repair protein RecN (Recombination protein N)
MLKSIYIDNYALIERLELDLQGGLSIVTGETGAGKSILLGALGLILGKRADTSVLNDSTRKCVIEGVFQLDGYRLEPFFEANEIDYQSETIIRREISNSGKSRAFINDTPVNLDVVQALTVSLIDIHSQYQNLALNSEDYLQWVIDCFAGITSEVEDHRARYKRYIQLKKEFNKACEAYKLDKENFDLLNHQFNELQSAKLVPGEMDQLEEEFEVLNHSEEIKSALESCIQLLSDDDQGIIRGLKQINDLLARIKPHFPKVNDFEERMLGSFIEIKDMTSGLTNYFEKLDFDPGRMEVVSQRLDLLHTLLHKYKVQSIGDLIEIRDRLDNKLRQFAYGDTEIEKLEKELSVAEMKIMQSAHQISEKRRAVFVKFEERVQHLVRSLGMKNARFSVAHSAKDLSDTGIDRIQFLFSANTNVPVQQISKVASGGELSRLMLSVKYLISSASGLPTIIFDEIDTGVSGEIADKVGRLIKEMSANMQVINITHLPQVASKGDQHFLVYKEVIHGTTLTQIKKLNNTERLNEIARMLSGDSVSEAAIANARVLLGG